MTSFTLHFILCAVLFYFSSFFGGSYRSAMRTMTALWVYRKINVNHQIYVLSERELRRTEFLISFFFPKISMYFLLFLFSSFVNSCSLFATSSGPNSSLANIPDQEKNTLLDVHKAHQIIYENGVSIVVLQRARNVSIVLVSGYIGTHDIRSQFIGVVVVVGAVSFGQFLLEFTIYTQEECTKTMYS